MGSGNDTQVFTTIELSPNPISGGFWSTENAITKIHFYICIYITSHEALFYHNSKWVYWKILHVIVFPSKHHSEGYSITEASTKNQFTDRGSLLGTSSFLHTEKEQNRLLNSRLYHTYKGFTLCFGMAVTLSSTWRCVIVLRLCSGGFLHVARPLQV